MKPINAPLSRVDEVVNRIRDTVERGELIPGQQLPSETALSEQFCISRNVLREAIKRLESVGLLNVRRGLGTFVNDAGSLSATARLIRSVMVISPRDVVKVAEFRRAIECDAVRITAANATPADLAALESCYAAMTNASPDDAADIAKVVETDFKFHQKIVEIAGNVLMQNVMNTIQEFIFAGIIHTLPASKAENPPKDFHVAILEAIRMRDPDAAESAMREHMDVLIARLEQVGTVILNSAKPQIN